MTVDMKTLSYDRIWRSLVFSKQPEKKEIKLEMFYFHFRLFVLVWHWEQWKTFHVDLLCKIHIFRIFVLPFMFLLFLKTAEALKNTAVVGSYLMFYGVWKMSRLKNLMNVESHSTRTLPLPSNTSRALPLPGNPGRALPLPSNSRQSSF